MLFFLMHMVLFSVVWGFLPASPLTMVFSHIMIFLVPLAVWLAIFKEKINTHLPHTRLGKKNLIYIAAISILIIPPIMAVTALTNFIFPNNVSDVLLVMAENNSYPVMLLAIAATPAICEEVVFRGYILSTYKNKPLLTALLINGLFFAIMHVNPHQFFYAFIAGVVFSYMVFVTQSIRAGIIAHFIINAISVTILYFSTPPDEPSQATLAEIFMLGTVVAISAALVIIIFREFINHNKKRAEEISEPHATPAEKNRRHLAIDAALVLAVIVFYVLLVCV
jgi:hypothetical protein